MTVLRRNTRKTPLVYPLNGKNHLKQIKGDQTMTLVKFNKTDNLPNFIDRFFQGDPFLSSEIFNQHKGLQHAMPAVNIAEQTDAFIVELAVPGRKKEDFSIEVHEQTLTIKGESKAEQEEKNNQGRYTRREFSYHAFSRSFQLPQTIDPQRIDAQYEAGVLQITLAKKEEAKDKGPRNIAIR
jgi:HSP20 family protein